MKARTRRLAAGVAVFLAADSFGLVLALTHQHRAPAPPAVAFASPTLPDVSFDVSATIPPLPTPAEPSLPVGPPPTLPPPRPSSTPTPTPALSANWLNKRYGEDQTGYDPGDGSLSDASLSRLNAHPTHSSTLDTPILVGDVLLVNAGDGVQALSASSCRAGDCRPLWTVDAGVGPNGRPNSVVGSPASDGRTVFFDVNVDQQGGWLEAVPVAGCGVTVCTPAWRMQVGVNNAPPGASYWYGQFADGPLVANGLVFAGSQQPRQPLVAVPAAGCSATCSPVWTASLEGAVSGVPAYSGGFLYVAEGPDMVAYRAAGCGAPTCGPVWKTHFGGMGVVNATPAVGGGRVVVTTADGMLRCLDAATGTPVWSVQVGDPNNQHGLRSSPLLAASTVVVGHDSAVDARSLATGALLWTAPVNGSGADASPTGSGGVVFVALGAEVQAFDLAGCGASSCAARWTGSVGGPTVSGARGTVVAGGALYAPISGLVVFSTNP